MAGSSKVSPITSKRQNPIMTPDTDAQPLLPEADVSDDDVTSQGQVTRRNIRNLLVANGIIAIVATAGVLYELTVTQFIYARLTSQLFGGNFSSPAERPCFTNASDPYRHKADQVQALASDKTLQLRLALAGSSLVSTALAGAYSDYLGRRPLFLASLLGFLCQSVVTAVVSAFRLPLDWLFLGALLNGCCGGFYTLILAMHAYTADNTPASGARTMGLALAGAGVEVASMGASVGAGYFVQLTGFVYPLLTTCGLMVVAVVVTAVFVEETRRATLGFFSLADWPSPLQALKDIFGFYFCKLDSAEPGLRRGGGHSAEGEHTLDLSQEAAVAPRDRRVEYCLAVVVFFFAVLPEMALGTINMLYVMNEPFCWDSEKIGIYTATRGIIQRLVSLTVLKTTVQCIREEGIGVLSMLSMAGGFLVMALASHDWMLYLAPAVGSLASLATIIMKSLMSQRAPPGKQGSLFAGLSVLETACSAVGGLIFNNLYSATVSTVRGATYLLTTALVLLGLVVMGAYIYVIHRNPRSLTVTIQSEEERESDRQE